jgi:hypothetical protein
MVLPWTSSSLSLTRCEMKYTARQTRPEARRVSDANRDAASSDHRK